MQKLRYGVVAMALLMCLETPASAQVSIGIGIGLPNVSIGINIPLFPELVRVPGYPVYYAPRLTANYFFYDGMYWVYLDDNWYASSWYNGPWWLVEPEVVPLFILRIPVRYYRYPPAYFRGWRPDAPPRWGEYWGRDWEQRHRGWDRWRRSSAPAPAPLPLYQRQYSGDRYPSQVEQQQRLHSQKYRYQPRDRAIRQHFRQSREPGASGSDRRERQHEPRMRETGPQDMQQPGTMQPGGPAGPRPQPPHQAPPQQRGPAYQEQRPQPGVFQREQRAPRPQGQEPRGYDRGKSQEPRDQEERREDGRGRERD